MSDTNFKTIKTYKSFLIPVTTEEFNESEEFIEHLIHYNKTGKIIETSKLNAFGNLEDKISMKYDENDYLIEELHFYEDDENFTERKIYIRNEKALLTSEEKYYLDGSVEKTDYEYDEKGNIIKKSQIDEDSETEIRFEFQYDEKNRIVESCKFESANLTEKISMHYDENNHLAKAEEWDYFNNTYSLTINTYNEKKELTETIVKNNEGHLIAKIQNSYNDLGLVVSRVLETMKNYYSKEIVEFIYDDKNQLSEEITLNPDGEVKKKISYYYDDSGNQLESIHYDIENTENPGVHYWKIRHEYEMY